MKDVDSGQPTSFFDNVYLGCTQRDCQTSKDIVDNYRNMFESKISAGAAESYPILRNLAQTFPHGSMTWKVMQRNVWSDIASWRTEQLKGCTKSQHHALTTTKSKKTKWDLLDHLSKDCFQFVPKFLYLARVGRRDILWLQLDQSL